MTSDLQNFLSILFEPNETVVTGNMYDILARPQSDASGNFISINPIHHTRKDSNVTSFRNFLIEMDEGALTKDEQMDLARSINLPFSTAVWSGGKSVHFIISLVEPIDEPTWRKWAEALIKAVPGADPSTKNPSRFTRLPGAFRRDRQTTQNLLYSGGRVPNEDVEKFCKPHIIADVPNFRNLYNKMVGVSGIEAAHPMTRAFIAGTHPCKIGRNNALFRSAADLRDVGLSIEDAGDLLHGPALELGLSEKEVVQTIRSAYSRARAG